MADWLDEEIGGWDPNAGSGSSCGCMTIPIIILVGPALLILALALIALLICVLFLLVGLVVWYVLPQFGMDVTGIQLWMESLADSVLQLLMSYG